MRTFNVSLLAAGFAVFRNGASQGEVRPPIKPVVQTPSAAEQSPPGDIPDNQVFVTYQSPLGFPMKVPEGWALRKTSQSVEFADKYNHIAENPDRMRSAGPIRHLRWITTSPFR
jgi:hypothetical protein